MWSFLLCNRATCYTQNKTLYQLEEFWGIFEHFWDSLIHTNKTIKRQGGNRPSEKSPVLQEQVESWRMRIYKRRWQQIQEWRLGLLVKSAQLKLNQLQILLYDFRVLQIKHLLHFTLTRNWKQKNSRPNSRLQAVSMIRKWRGWQSFYGTM